MSSGRRLTAVLVPRHLLLTAACPPLLLPCRQSSVDIEVDLWRFELPAAARSAAAAAADEASPSAGSTESESEGQV